MSGEYETYLKILQGNDTFCKTEEIDSNLKIAIILLYLKANYSVLESLELRNLEVLKDILLNDNYTIVEERIIYNGTIIEIPYLIEIINLVRHHKDAKQNNVIDFKSRMSDKVIKLPQSSEAKIIEFKPKQEKVKTYEELSAEFNITFNVTQEMTYYVEETEERFKDLMNEIIDGLLSNRLKDIDKSTLSFLSGLLNIYALNYIHQHDKQYLNSIILPSSHIAIGKSNYGGQEVHQCIHKIETAKARMQEIDRKERVLDYFDRLSTTAYERFEQEKEIIGNDIMKMFSDLYYIRSKPYIYNPHLVENIMRSIIENHVEMNTKYSKPRLKFFCLEKDAAIFHSAMSLDTLNNLINKEDLLQLNYQPKKKQ